MIVPLGDLFTGIAFQYLFYYQYVNSQKNGKLHPSPDDDDDNTISTNELLVFLKREKSTHDHISTSPREKSFTSHKSSEKNLSKNGAVSNLLSSQYSVNLATHSQHD